MERLCWMFVACFLLAQCRLVTNSDVSDVTGPNGEPFTALSVEQPAFTKVLYLNGGRDPALLISRFGKDANGKNLPGLISIVPNLNKVDWQDYHGSSAELPVSTISGLVWPNQVTDPQVIAGREVIAVAEGFFSFPFAKESQAGTVTLLSVDQIADSNKSPLIHRIFPKEKSWFYHQADWIDMDHDGLLDLLTARSNWNPILSLLDANIAKVYGKLQWLPFIKKLMPPEFVRGEMVWFKNPGPGTALAGEWKKNLLLDDKNAAKSAPDLFFRFCQIGGKTVLIAPAAWKGRFTVFWRQDEKAAWTSPLRQRVFSEDFGSLIFDVQCIDLNGDGRNDILFSNHEAEAERSAVYALDFVGGSIEGDVIPHKLQGNILTTKPGRGQASPGAATAYYPAPSVSKKPFIVVSGDGAEQVYLLRPEQTAWKYSAEVLLDARKTSSKEGSITGGIDIGQVDDHLNREAFVPLYDWNQVQILRLP